MSKDFEQVLVISRKAFVEFVDGFLARKMKPDFTIDPESIIDDELISNTSFFMPRYSAETDENYLQLIPYVLVSFVDSDGKFRYLAYRRKKQSGESRLHGKLSIGIGGHINDVDLGCNLSTIIGKAINRELYEELMLGRYQYTLSSCIATIYDDKDAVGRVHFGLVYSAQINDDELNSIETEDTMEIVGYFTKDKLVEKLASNPDDFEGWSRIVIEKGYLE